MTGVCVWAVGCQKGTSFVWKTPPNSPLYVVFVVERIQVCSNKGSQPIPCLLYTSDAADDMQCVDLGGRRIIKKNPH